MILIVSESDDVHATHVGNLLERRGVAYTHFATSDFPSRASITATGEGRCLLRLEQRTVSLTEVGALWYRRPGKPVASPRLRSAAARTCAELQSEVLLV